MGYFVSVLRERIATFEAKNTKGAEDDDGGSEGLAIEGVSISDLRKNLNELNSEMDRECLSSAARYGVVLDASLITGMDPPDEVESALSAINTAHNEVSAAVSLARATADQKIEQSKRAVEIETMRAHAEVEPLLRLSEQLQELKKRSGDALAAYLRKIELDLLSHVVPVGDVLDELEDRRAGGRLKWVAARRRKRHCPPKKHPSRQTPPPIPHRRGIKGVVSGCRKPKKISANDSTARPRYRAALNRNPLAASSATSS